MIFRDALHAAVGVSLSLALCVPSFAAERVPMSLPAAKGPRVVLVSDSPAFDRACTVYYRQGNDPDVSRENVPQFCTCLAAEYANNGLGTDALDFFARTLSEDLTTFIDEYPQGDSWMRVAFAADTACKDADYGSNEPPPQGNMTQIPAGSWGGIVRDGPGQNYRKVASLRQGDRVMLNENTGVIWNDYPWWKIEYGANFSGYMWGGILCSLNAPMDGIYETCE